MKSPRSCARAHTEPRPTQCPMLKRDLQAQPLVSSMPWASLAIFFTLLGASALPLKAAVIPVPWR